MATVIFAVYDADGVPLVGATPELVQYRTAFAAVPGVPVVRELGGGLYAFATGDVESEVGVAYLVSTGASPAFLSGSVGPLVAFGLYDEDGAPHTGATPVFSSFRDSTTGLPMTAPQLLELGGGLYGFHPEPAHLEAEAAWAVATGASPEWLTGSLAQATTEDVTLGGLPEVTWLAPVPGSPISAVQPLSFEVVDPEGLLGDVLVLAAFPGVYEVVHDGASFGPNYVESPNGRAPITNGWRYTVLRRGGWPDSPRVKVCAFEQLR